MLRDRIDHLGDYLTHHSDHRHANLDYELTYITATADIAAEFCADLMDTTAPAPSKPGVSAANASTLTAAGKTEPTAQQASLV